ncbi:hypothetical protein KL86DYS2_12588 [uncultured Dysgonomonas sp.]|uniref:Uncharacterized protein n=1 Tax=uncultured Dysgonomonas sp. TaxID=206096 RepID=A0A212JYG8_9BACT|nr:hypothetical protein KL86DYS2_12588 [uncultured Dysgonomonas sp.]
MVLVLICFIILPVRDIPYTNGKGNDKKKEKHIANNFYLSDNYHYWYVVFCQTGRILYSK